MSRRSKVTTVLKFEEKEEKLEPVETSQNSAPTESSQSSIPDTNQDTLPMNLGVVRLINLGRVEFEKKGFHNERYIFPVGYKSERMYNSYINPNEKVVYTCEILEDPNSELPLFKVTAADDAEEFTSNTPTGAWTPIIKKVQETRKSIGIKRQHTTVSGPEYFGLSHTKCKQLVEALAGSEKCEKFIPLPKPEVFKEEVAEIQEEDPGMKNRLMLELKPRKSRRTPSKKTVKKQDETPKKSSVKYPGLNPDTPLELVAPHQYRYLSQGFEVFDGYEPFASVVKKELESSSLKQSPVPKMVPFIPIQSPIVQKVPILPVIQPNHNTIEQRIPLVQKQPITNQGVFTHDFEADLKSLRSIWEFAYVSHYINILRTSMKLSEFTTSEFEMALVKPHEHNELLADIHIRLIKGPTLDKKSLDEIDKTNLAWIGHVQRKLDGIDGKVWEQNPLKRQKYHNLTPLSRILILKSILEWRIYQNQKITDFMHGLGEIARVDPLGFDNAGNTYWYFGEEVGRVFMEAPYKKDSQSSLWSTLTTNLTEFKQLLTKFEDALEEKEIALFDNLASYYKTLEIYIQAESDRIKRREEQKAEEKRRYEELEKKRQEQAILYEQQKLEKKRREEEAAMAKMYGTPVKNGELTEEKVPFEAEITRSGRVVRKKIYSEVFEDDDDEEEGDDDDQDHIEDKEEIKEEIKMDVQKKKKKKQEDDEFRMEEEEHDEDEMEEESEEGEDDYDDEDEDEEEYDENSQEAPKKLVGRKTKIAIPNTGTMQIKPLQPLKNPFVIAPSGPKMSLPPPGIPTMQQFITSPDFQSMYNGYVKMMIGTQKTGAPVQAMPQVVTPQKNPPLQFHHYQNPSPNSSFNMMSPQPSPMMQKQTPLMQQMMPPKMPMQQQVPPKKSEDQPIINSSFSELLEGAGGEEDIGSIDKVLGMK